MQMEPLRCSELKHNVRTIKYLLSCVVQVIEATSEHLTIDADGDMSFGLSLQGSRTISFILS